MATNIRQDDVIAAVEKYLVDNWPNSSWQFIPTAADTARPNTPARPVAWVALQWLSYQTARPVRPSEDFVELDFRLICRARSTDRLKAGVIANDFRDLLRSTTIDVVDRTDAATARGYVRLNEVNLTDVAREATDQTVCAVEVIGTAHTL